MLERVDVPVVAMCDRLNNPGLVDAGLAELRGGRAFEIERDDQTVDRVGRRRPHAKLQHADVLSRDAGAGCDVGLRETERLAASPQELPERAGRRCCTC